VCELTSLFLSSLSLWPNIEVHLKGCCITLISSVCLTERSVQMAAWWPPLSSLFPFTWSRRGTTAAGTTFFANANGLFLCHCVLLSWPILWVWLKSTPKHNQTGQVLIAAWLLACVRILCKQWINQCFGLVPFACWWIRENALTCSSMMFRYPPLSQSFSLPPSLYLLLKYSCKNS
jgi:hypothetical protein